MSKDRQILQPVFLFWAKVLAKVIQNGEFLPVLARRID